MSDFLFKSVYIIIKPEFFRDNELVNIEEARRRSNIILMFLMNNCPMRYYFEARYYIKNPSIFEYYDVPVKYLVETSKFIESHDDLRKYIEVTIKY